METPSSRHRAWRAVSVLGMLTLIVPATGAATTAARDGPTPYHYYIDLKGHVSGANYRPDGTSGIAYSGSLSADWQVDYAVVFTIDKAARMVAVAADPVVPIAPSLRGGILPAFFIGGVASFHETATCSGSPCTGPPTMCDYSNVGLEGFFISSLSPSWGQGSDAASYANKQINLYLQTISAPTPPSVYPCTPASSGSVTPRQDTVPGIGGGCDAGPLAIPLGDIGRVSRRVLTLTPKQVVCKSGLGLDGNGYDATIALTVLLYTTGPTLEDAARADAFVAKAIQEEEAKAYAKAVSALTSARRTIAAAETSLTAISGDFRPSASSEASTAESNMKKAAAAIAIHPFPSRAELEAAEAELHTAVNAVDQIM